MVVRRSADSYAHNLRHIRLNEGARYEPHGKPALNDHLLFEFKFPGFEIRTSCYIVGLNRAMVTIGRGPGSPMRVFRLALM